MSVNRHSFDECARILQDSQVRLNYLAEGAANIIYNIVPLDQNHANHQNCCVLRIRKDLPSTKSCQESIREFEQTIVALFRDFNSDLLINQVLYKLTPDLIISANSQLKSMDDESRPEHRRYKYHPSIEQENYGILMPNLDTGEDIKLIEFKPKWLVQSPSAPDNAFLCRTCALNASRRAQGQIQGRGDSGFCPFDLLSTDTFILSKALQCIWPDQKTLPQLIKSFQRTTQPVLRHLQRVQNRYSQVGVDDYPNPDNTDLPTAMALRDCSVFLRIFLNPTKAELNIVDIKFADLDLKTATEGKVQKWIAIEQELIDTGAYSGKIGFLDVCGFGRMSSSTATIDTD